jgi:membrane protein implicated in regulation of membrane protease activity
MDRLPMNPASPTWRKPAGIFLILLLIAVWAAIVATGAELIGNVPWPVQAVYFIVAGIVWILPLKPLLRWMETGYWRTPR